uniref:Glycerol-3-phosphate dehydrogenase [NAD(+)] n=1 Tax=Schistocephalus solidus TaxID=70667 RepID=A0A183T2V0_SCHSO
LLRGFSIMSTKRRVAIIGSGNWGSTIGKIVGNNVLNLENFEDEVRMWVYEEIVNGKKLTEIINTSHENIKYLPGIKLPFNLIADPDLANCTKDADVLLFVLPHQFLAKACDIIKPVLKSGAYGCSLIKGLDEKPGVGVRLLTDLIRERLQIPCAVLMGANLAGEVSQEMFCEATVASLDLVRGKELKSLFQTPYFRVSVIKDEVGAELCGALKNIVAIGAGLAHGLGYGDNTKAAIIRLGFMEMKKFIFEFFAPLESTFLESCGVADLITTCYGGRNRKIGIALAETEKPVTALEGERLGGQSAQGVLTAAEVYSMLSSKRLDHQFPIFTIIHLICQRKAQADTFISCLRNHPEHL